jgi:hypothetical protein
METTIPSYLASAPSRDLIVAGHQQITRLWWENRKNQFAGFNEEVQRFYQRLPSVFGNVIFFLVYC